MTALRSKFFFLTSSHLICRGAPVSTPVKQYAISVGRGLCTEAETRTLASRYPLGCGSAAAPLTSGHVWYPVKAFLMKSPRSVYHVHFERLPGCAVTLEFFA